jgi:four helix bundle protein
VANNNYNFSFEKLHVWKESRAFTSKMYDITKNFPGEEKFGLVNQIRRASVSIAANIAEGSSRTSSKDQAHFTQMAYSSLMETLSHLYIALDLNYIIEAEFNDSRAKIMDISNMLNALRNKQLKS